MLELLQPLVEGILNDKNLSINTNPLEVYKAWINQMESETGEARYGCITGSCVPDDELFKGLIVFTFPASCYS